MLDDEQRRWRKTLQTAEVEELATIEPIVDAQRDSAIADAIVAHRQLELAHFSGGGRRHDAHHKPHRRLALAIGTVALVASLALLLTSYWRTTSIAPLPDYELRVYGDDTIMGTAASQPALPHLTMDSTLKLELRPTRNVTGAVHVWGFLRQGARLVPWPVTLDPTSQGTLKLHKKVRELPELSTGDWEVVFVLSRDAHVPTVDKLTPWLTRHQPGAVNGWQLKRVRFLIEP